MALRPLVTALMIGTAVLLPAQEPARAETAQAGQVQALSDALLIGDVMAVLRDEGMANAAELSADFVAGNGSPAWDAAVSQIYDTARMRRDFDAALAEALAGQPQAVAAALAFFGTDPGARALRLEIDARRALLDPEAETAAGFAWEDMVRQGLPRARQIERFAEVNDLLESNVMGALNANLAFFHGMAEAGGPLAEMSESDLLAMVWESEAETRGSTAKWMFPFLALAYEPLSDAELDANIAFSETPEGQRVNAAIFAAFDRIFLQISRDLGRAAGREMVGQDI